MEFGDDLEYARIAAESRLGIVEVDVADTGVSRAAGSADAAHIADRAGDELGVIEQVVSLAGHFEAGLFRDLESLQDGEVEVVDGTGGLRIDRPALSGYSAHCGW